MNKNWVDIKIDVETPIDTHVQNDMKHMSSELVSSYLGIVEDNNDPQKIGRCKIRVWGLMDMVDVVDLPWMLPDFTFVGSHTGSFVVPPVGCHVKVEFINGDVYNPRYSSKIIEPDKLPRNRLKNYPNTMVMWETDSGTSITIDRTDDTTVFKHKSGTTFTINPNGSVVVDPVSTFELNGSTVVPSDHGPLNCIQICPFANIPHVGTISLSV